MPDYLFNSGHLHQFLDGKLSEMGNEVMGFERDYLLNASEDDLCTYLVNKYTLDPPKIRIAEKVIADNTDSRIQRTRVEPPPWRIRGRPNCEDA